MPTPYILHFFMQSNIQKFIIYAKNGVNKYFMSGDMSTMTDLFRIATFFVSKVQKENWETYRMNAFRSSAYIEKKTFTKTITIEVIMDSSTTS